MSVQRVLAWSALVVVAVARVAAASSELADAAMNGNREAVRISSSSRERR
jgi:hypothetical protein